MKTDPIVLGCIFFVLAVISGAFADSGQPGLSIAFGVTAVLDLACLITQYLDSGEKLQDVDRRRRESNYRSR